MKKMNNKYKNFCLGVGLRIKIVSVVRFAHTDGLKENQKVDITPILVYENADLLKLQAVSENKGKSGVYR